MPYKNTFLPQLIIKHNFFQKSKGFQRQKEIKEYLLIIKHSYVQKDLPQKNVQTELKLLTLDEISEDEQYSCDNDNNTVSLTTTLHPPSYVQKLLNFEIINYAKKGITIARYIVKTPYSATRRKSYKHEFLLYTK